MLFVDADDQEPVHEFSVQRELATSGKIGYTSIRQPDKGVRSEVIKLASKFDVDEKAIAEFIALYNTIFTALTSKPFKSTLLRVYRSQLEEVEEILQTIPKRQRPSRHAYIIKALEEKVQKTRPS